ncbi:MAG TPA: nucleoside triphosphate pyrophosphohydrolase [Ignavibacteria bacterium]|nr:nucleoside triphosphate pyrophosphohydrolase [Ignavibacteria bacterium]
MTEKTDTTELKNYLKNYSENNLKEEFIKFYELVKLLRNECPWDKEQTRESLRRCLLEETYEVLEAIDNNNIAELEKELGDLLLQVIFHSVIAEQENLFSLKSILQIERKKLIERHPHIFENLKVNGSDEVKTNWEKLKKKEGRLSVLDGIPAELPALLKAFRIQEKAAKVGFDWKDEKPVFGKILEELNELKSNIDNKKDLKDIENEFGDLLFSIVNYARFLKINPEDALRGTINKFRKRFNEIEKFAKENNFELENMTLKEMDEIWERAKTKD